MSALPPASTSQKLEKLISKTAQYSAAFQRSYPEFFLQIQHTRQSDAESQATIPETRTFSPQAATMQKLATEISLEEYQAVLDKTRALSHLPPGKLDIETALYLEQQLGDLLGFQIATRLQNQELIHTYGTIRAVPHLKRSPIDTPEAHDYNRASFSNKRSYFGWLHQHKSAQTSPELHEKYFLAFPFHLLPNWQTQSASYKKWFGLRKVVVINPHEQRAVVASVLDSYDFGYTKYQFGGSPELIIEGKCWSPAALGKVFVFFVVDELDQVPLGPVSLHPYKGLHE
jgi:hypothetical protein